MLKTNPLLLPYELPPFQAIQVEHLVPAVQAIIAENHLATAAIINSQAPFPTWDDLVLAVDELEARLEETLGIIQLLGSTHRAPAWHEAIFRCHALAEQYKHDRARNAALYRLYRQLADSPIAALFNQQRQCALRKALRHFHFAGLDLALDQQVKLRDLNDQISQWQHEFLERVDDSNKAWSKHIEDSALLSGLSPAALISMQAAAQASGLPGWLLTLSDHTYQEVMTYADNRALRQEMMTAYYSRASGTASDGSRDGNEPVLTLLLEDRHEKARLLGYPNFAQLALADQMADTPEQVVRFLRQQIEQARSTFTRDAEQLEHYAQQHGITGTRPWDHDYFAQKIREDIAGISQSALREYFPWENVLQHLRTLVQMLMGVELLEQSTADTWHTDVRVFEVREYAQPLGYLFVDPYRREGKSEPGATVGLRNRRISTEGRPRHPIAVLSIGLSPPTDTQPCLLDHLQLRVLLHEFGHCCQHLLTAAPYRTISGVGQLAHDTSEFVSQVFEQFCFEASFLTWLSGHFQSGQPLPQALASRVTRYVQTQTSWETASLLLTAWVDLELHRAHGDGQTPDQVFTRVNAEIGHLQWPEDARPVNSFEQLVGDYGARIYSYRWSGVLAARAFARFKRDGLFNPATAQAFRAAFITHGDDGSLISALASFVGNRESARI
ncbi:M3 family metallopeptidase [Pseudomonas sp.]|jgi:oligopeptidase A|uniref:M3 family metallopeptidase n=1 Tax=Pseudomonas sp. TaxID=306 RepID=UPI0028AB3F14|nr:M3 family metallopeptidase [Pseudomonas sp.]